MKRQWGQTPSNVQRCELLQVFNVRMTYQLFIIMSISVIFPPVLCQRSEHSNPGAEKHVSRSEGLSGSLNVGAMKANQLLYISHRYRNIQAWLLTTT